MRNDEAAPAPDQEELSLLGAYKGARAATASARQ